MRVNLEHAEAFLHIARRHADVVSTVACNNLPVILVLLRIGACTSKRTCDTRPERRPRILPQHWSKTVKYVKTQLVYCLDVNETTCFGLLGGHHQVLQSSKRLNIFVCILLGISPASDCGLPTFRNPLSVPSSRAGCKVWSMNSERRTWYLYQGRGLLELAEPMGRTPGKYPKKYIQDSKHGESLKSRSSKYYLCVADVEISIIWPINYIWDINCVWAGKALDVRWYVVSWAGVIPLGHCRCYLLTHTHNLCLIYNTRRRIFLPANWT